MEQAPRRRLARALILGALAAIVVTSALAWASLHRVRASRDAELEGVCHAHRGRPRPVLDAAFARLGVAAQPDGSRRVNYVELTSSLQSFCCIADLTPDGEVATTHVFRMTYQEAYWGPAPIEGQWVDAAWRTAVLPVIRASSAITP